MSYIILVVLLFFCHFPHTYTKLSLNFKSTTIIIIAIIIIYSECRRHQQWVVLLRRLLVQLRKLSATNTYCMRMRVLYVSIVIQLFLVFEFVHHSYLFSNIPSHIIDVYVSHYSLHYFTWYKFTPIYSIVQSCCCYSNSDSNSSSSSSDNSDYSNSGM